MRKDLVWDKRRSSLILLLRKNLFIMNRNEIKTQIFSGFSDSLPSSPRKSRRYLEVLVWDLVWNEDMITEVGKMKLGMV